MTSPVASAIVLIGSKIRLLACLFLSLMFLACSCTPSANYDTDPLSKLSVGTVANSEDSKPRLGIIFTENTETAIKLVQETRSFASMGGLNFGFNYEEIDADYLVEQINRVLARRFSSVTRYQTVQAIPWDTVDTAMALDIRVKFGKVSSAQTNVQISGTILDDSGNPRDTVLGEGSGVVPWPAFTYNFKPAVNQSVQQFSYELDGFLASKEKEFLKKKPRKVVEEKQPQKEPETVAAIQKEKVVETVSPPAPAKSAVAPGTGKSWAVIVGIAQYQYAGKAGLENLSFADDDALAFANALKRLGWSDSHMTVLINEEAKQRNLVIALESWLTKARPGDQIVLFWAGHGYPDPQDPEKVYFACYDTDITIPATGYRMDKVRRALEERNAKNVLVFADTCHAGKLITRGPRSISIVPTISKMNREQTIPKGWIFMVGADTDRQSVEHSSWSNGAFTHCLLRGLQSEADGYQSAGAKDGRITMGELKNYLVSSMPEETHKVLGAAKHPVIITSSGDPDIWNITLQRSQ